MAFSEVIDRTKSAVVASEQTHVGQSYSKLIWIFMIMSIAGLAGETLQHYIAFGVWESRPGFIWGPFSPIYGLAAVLLTVFLEPLQKKPLLLILVVAGTIGGSLEYFASWAMETVWGVVAWSYLDWPLNFDGRTDVFHMFVWGSLGTIWVKIGLPLCEKAFSHVDLKSRLFKFCTAVLSVYMACDIVMTIAVLARTDARADGVPPQTAFEQFIDDNYPTDMLTNRFQNMGGLGM